MEKRDRQRGERTIRTLRRRWFRGSVLKIDGTVGSFSRSGPSPAGQVAPRRRDRPERLEAARMAETIRPHHRLDGLFSPTGSQAARPPGAKSEMRLVTSKSLRRHAPWFRERPTWNLKNGAEPLVPHPSSMQVQVFRFQVNL